MFLGHGAVSTSAIEAQVYFFFLSAPANSPLHQRRTSIASRDSEIFLVSSAFMGWLHPVPHLLTLCLCLL